jgi:protein TonB
VKSNFKPEIMNQKIKIMKPAPQLSDEEIRGFMDFGNVLKQRNTVALRRNAIRWTLGIAIVSAVLFVSVDQYLRQNRTYDSIPQAAKAPLEEATQPAEKNTIIADSSLAPSETQPQNEKEKAKSSDSETPGSKLSSPNAGNDEVEPIVSNEKHEQIIAEDVYVQAEPVNGYDELYAYFNKNLSYPREALRDSIQGAVVVVFIVNVNGSAENIEVRNPLGDAFGKQVVDMIARMPPWKPATLNGKPVPSRITLPLTFQIERLKK